MLIRVLVGDWYYNGWLCLVCVLDCMDIVVKEEFKVYIDLLIVDEYDVLECSILVEGCCDVLVLWGDVLVDGYNCYGICCKYNFLFQIVQNMCFQLMDDVYLWMIEQYLGCCSVLDFQCGVLVLCKCDILVECYCLEQVQLQKESDGMVIVDVVVDDVDSLLWVLVLKVSWVEMVCEVCLSNSQVMMIECIYKQVVLELVEVVKIGVILISVVVVVVVLFEDEQCVVVVVGKDELKQVVKCVCDVKCKLCKLVQEVLYSVDEDVEVDLSCVVEIVDVFIVLGEGLVELCQWVIVLMLENDILCQQLVVLCWQLVEV